MQKDPLSTKYACKSANYDLAGIDLNDSVLLRFQPGEAILREGMPMEYLLFVISGKAKVCSATADGKEFLLCHYISEGIIGDLELMIDSYISSATISAITEFLCIGLPYTNTQTPCNGLCPWCRWWDSDSPAFSRVPRTPAQDFP